MARSRPDDTSGRKCEKVFASADVADGQAFSVSADNSDSSKKICPKFSQRFAVGVHKGTTGLPVGLHVTVPHPVNFALHKLIIFQRRFKQEKAEKDRDVAVKILRALIKKGDSRVIKKVFNSVPKKWQKKILEGLDKAQEKEISDMLQR